jgi:hypothetical protein
MEAENIAKLIVYLCCAMIIYEVVVVLHAEVNNDQRKYSKPMHWPGLFPEVTVDNSPKSFNSSDKHNSESVAFSKVENNSKLLAELFRTTSRQRFKLKNKMKGVKLPLKLGYYD